MYSGRAGADALDSPELEQACSLNCEARHNAACSMNTGSLDQCLGQCLVADEANAGYCWPEYTRHYACLAAGGYTCVSGYPQPKSTCISESQALSMCVAKVPCQRFCARAQGQCAPSGTDCMSACTMEQNGFEDAICGVYYQQLLSCWGQSLTCDGERPAIAPCGAQLAEVADCLSRRQDACEGFCWTAQRAGCGSEQCLTECRAKLNESRCGSSYRNLIECTFENRAVQLTCEAGVPTPATQCASQATQYDTCRANL